MNKILDENARLDRLFGVPKPVPAPLAKTTAPAVTAPARPPLHFGNWQQDGSLLTIPAHLETKHMLAIGTTGSGKSQALYTGVLSPIRQRDEPAIIIDHSSEFLQRYYRQGVDVIFNPFDERGVGWSPFNEIRRVYDFDRIAKAIVPDTTENPTWQLAAQQLLANAMRGLWKLGKLFRTTEALIWYLTEAPNQGREFTAKFLAPDGSGKLVETQSPLTLEALMLGSTSIKLFDSGSDKQLSNVLGILGRYLQPLTYLQPGDFSMTDYVRQFEKVGECHSWLFLSYTDASYAAIAPLFSIMVTCGISSGMELSENNDRRFYFVLDEFSSLEKIDAIEDAMTKLRKRGGVMVAGIQSTAQLQGKYGEIGAQILLSCFSNILMLKVADDQTAEKLSRMIGDIEENEVSTSESVTTTNEGTSHTKGSSRQKVRKPSFMPGQFMAFDDLYGVARIAGNPDAKRTKVQISKIPKIAKAEETRTTVFLTH